MAQLRGRRETRSACSTLVGQVSNLNGEIVKYKRVLGGIAAAAIGAAFIGNAAYGDVSALKAAPTNKPSVSEAAPLPVEGIPDQLRLDINALEDSSVWQAVNDLSWDDGSQILHVHYLGTPGNLSTRVAAYLPSTSFDLVADRFSHTALVALSQQVADLAQATSYPLAAVGPKADNSGLDVREVLTADSTPSQRAVVAAFKSKVASITSIPILYSDVVGYPMPATRLSDSPPFYGGNRMYTRIDSTHVTTCTSGFEVHNGSSTAMMTADHCGGDGDKWYAGSGNTTNNFEGTMSSGNSGGSDFRKLTGASYDPIVWLGEKDSSTIQSVKGKFNAVNGDSVCVDGSYSGQRCAMKVENQDFTMCVFGHGCYNNEVDIKSASNSGTIQEGDSGSPTLVGTTGGALVGGVLTGYWPGTGASCVNGTSGPCYYEGFYAAVRAFLNNNPGWSVSTQ